MKARNTVSVAILSAMLTACSAATDSNSALASETSISASKTTAFSTAETSAVTEITSITATTETSVITEQTSATSSEPQTKELPSEVLIETGTFDLQPERYIVGTEVINE